MLVPASGRSYYKAITKIKTINPDRNTIMQIWKHVEFLVLLRNWAGLREQPGANVECCVYFASLIQDRRHWFIDKVQR